MLSPERAPLPIADPTARVEGHELRELTAGWQAARSAPEEHSIPAAATRLTWMRCDRRPGRRPVRCATPACGRERTVDFDAEDWWFRTRFDAEPAAAGEGVAPVPRRDRDRRRGLPQRRAGAGERLDVRRSRARRRRLLRGGNELAICCRALGPLLGVRRKPRARWRTKLVANGNLRFFRTMLLGRAPGIAPGPAAVGPWRGVYLERRTRVVVEQLALRARVTGEEGRLSVRARVRGLHGAQPVAAEIELRRGSGAWRAPLALTGGVDGVELEGDLVVPDVTLWWPHTHGEPAPYGAPGRHARHSR